MRTILSTISLPISSSICKLAVSICLLGLVGCASQAEIFFISQPEGAIISRLGSNVAFGQAPLTTTFDSSSIHGVDSQGCHILDGVEARWDSGAITQVTELRLCDGNSGNYYYRIQRPVSYPDLQTDIRKANQLRETRRSLPPVRRPDSARRAYGPS